MLRKLQSQARGLDAAGRAKLVSDAMRDILVTRYQSYLEHGLKGVDEYRRSKRKAINIGDELTLTVWQRTGDYLVITERHYYVTHTINSAQVTVCWLPYGDDTYMGLAISASTDVLESLMGKMLRPLGRNKARDMVTDVLTEFREEMEQREAEEEAE